MTELRWIIVLAATNILHSLDKVVVKLGRFDIHVQVPNLEGPMANPGAL
jgi:ATP-dependent Zn protease